MGVGVEVVVQFLLISRHWIFFGFHFFIVVFLFRCVFVVLCFALPSVVEKLSTTTL